MPHISMTLYAGRKPEDIQKMAEELRGSMMKAVGWRAEDISVSIHEVTPDAFTQTVRERLENEELILYSDYIRP